MRDFVKTRPGLIFHISGDNKMSNHKGQMPWNLHIYFASNCYKSKENQINQCAELQVFHPVISFSPVLLTNSKKQRGAGEQVERYTPVQGGSWKIEKAVGMRYLIFVVDGWDPMTTDLWSGPERYIFTYMNDRLVFCGNVDRYTIRGSYGKMETPTTQTAGPIAYSIRHASIGVI